MEVRQIMPETFPPAYFMANSHLNNGQGSVTTAVAVNITKNWALNIWHGILVITRRIRSSVVHYLKEEFYHPVNTSLQSEFRDEGKRPDFIVI
jgi:hypothetical protein